MIDFTKMHGLGNDYLFVDCLTQDLSGVDLPSLARSMSDRHRGVGSDGLILIRPPSGEDAADVRMEMYNADGSRGEMCGNGIRCLAKYVIERALVSPPIRVRPKTTVAQASRLCLHRRDGGATRVLGRTLKGKGPAAALAVQTDRGVLRVEALGQGGIVESVRVDMGPPILRPSDIPVDVTGDRCVRRPLVFDDCRMEMTCVSMGNPHAVVFADSIDAVDLARVGPRVEGHRLFPNRVNLHVASVHSRGEVSMRSWERGSGLTMACGTGACAVLVAGVLEGRLDRRAVIHLPGGDLTIAWADSPDGVSGAVFMTGPAAEVFSGRWPT